MDTNLRKTRIPSLGDVPWGTHICQFYKTKEDLVDMLVPYFKAGLENNEFCMWVTSDPLSDEEARGAIRQAFPQFDRYAARGQIEIVSHSEWYLKGGHFDLLDLQRVVQNWIKKLNHALARGYDGMRVTGNTAWLEHAGWGSFAAYEEALNNAIGAHKLI